MGKYVKNHTVYTKRTRHQGINGGVILERDWSTLGGEFIRFGKGKEPVYYDGNFLFTTAKFNASSKRNKKSEVSESLRYDDVKDAKPNVNNIVLNTKTDDVRNFAYYGSCIELIQTSLLNIINNFPGSIYTKEQTYSTGDDATTDFSVDGKVVYLVENPFEIDILTKDVKQKVEGNPYRLMCETYMDYEINGEPVTAFNVEHNMNECWQCDIWYNYKTYDLDFCSHVGQGSAPVIVTFNVGEEKTYVLYGFRTDDRGFVFFSPDKYLTICPNKDVIEKYFDNLKGFEKALLNRDSNPLYTNKFITLLETESGFTYEGFRRYRFPTVRAFINRRPENEENVNENQTYDDEETIAIKERFNSLIKYCIDVSESSNGYANYVNKLLNMAEKYDEVWTDNMYNRMTHEAIKNFDWNYSMEYNENDTEANIEGGQQMKSVIRFMGRIFDDIKMYVDGIGLANKVTEDGYTNVPDALLSDKLELNGWDVVSTIPVIVDDVENNGNVKLSEKYLKDNNLKWFGCLSPDDVNSTDYDATFQRRLLLSSRRIFQSKGTAESIDMIMGMFGFGRGLWYDRYYCKQDDEECGTRYRNDYEINESVYKVEVKKRYDDEDNDLVDVFQDRNKLRPEYIDDPEKIFPNLPLDIMINRKEDEDCLGKSSYQECIEKKHSYVIPFFNKDAYYGYDLYFQSKGGWGHLKKDTDEVFNSEYLETVSYLNVLSTVDDLFNVNSISTNSGDIFYVIDLSNYVKYYPNIVEDDYGKVSHFFYLKDGYLTTSFPEAWQNIGLVDVMKIGLDGHKEIDYNVLKYKQKAKYLDSIVNTTFGNNPHVGYGEYDCGNEYLEYMRNPFKYYEDNGVLNELEDDEEKSTYRFNIEEVRLKNGYGKSFNKLDTQLYTDIDANEQNGIMMLSAETDNPEYVFMNNKIVYLRNNINNDLFKRYFRNVMLPYILQVIPSTVILVLENYTESSCDTEL